MQYPTVEELRTPFLRVAATGPAGARKTTLLMHLPNTGPTWELPDGSPGKIVYIMADRTSEGLMSITDTDRQRIIPVLPDGGAIWKDGKPITDWKKEFFDICFTDWKAKFPEAVAVVWDSFTGTCYKILLENMKMGYFSDKGPKNTDLKITDRRMKEEKETVIKLGDKGDYRMVQETVMQGLDWFLSINSKLHVLCAFHECLGEGDEDGKGKVFGPSITGLKGPARIPFEFDVNLSLGVNDGKYGGKTGDTRIYTRNVDKYQANIKSTQKLPKAIFLKRDIEEIRDFWRQIQSLKGLGEKNVGSTSSEA